MIVYMIMIAITMLLADPFGKVRVSIKDSKRWWIALIPMIITASLRYSVGTDYHNYTVFFRSLLYSTGWKIEPAFRYVSLALMRLLRDPRWVFAFYAFFILLLIGLELKEVCQTTEYAEALYLFICMGYYYASLNIIRQYIAVAILFYATRYIRENRRRLYCLFVILAMGFHVSSAIGFIIPIICFRKYRGRFYVVVVLVGLLVLIFQKQFVSFLIASLPKYTKYIKQGKMALSFWETASYVIVYLVFLLLGVNRKQENAYLNFLFNTVFVSFIIYIIFNFIPNVNRLSIYFEIYLIEYGALLLCGESYHERNNRLIVNIFAFAVFLVTIGVIGRYDVVPYNTYLFA